MTTILDSTATGTTLDGRHGAYTYGFARDALGDHGLRTAVETGELIGFGRGVLLDARRVLDLRTRCAGALLLTGNTGVLVGPTAAALHGCAAIGGFPIHVRVPYAHRIRSRNGLVVHQGTTVPDDTTTLDGLRVLAADLTISDVLCSAPRRTALACADEALRTLHPDDRPAFRASIATHLSAKPDRRGTKRAAALLALASGLPESPAQSAFLLAMADSGIAGPVCQYEIRDRTGRVRHRLDFAWPTPRVAIEYDDSQQHQPDDQPDDLPNQGWEVIRADIHDLVDPTKVFSRLRTALHSRSQAA